MKLSQKAKSPFHRILVYGPPKSGKTELVAKLSSQFNLKYFDLEAGIATAQKFPEDWQERIEVFSIPDTRSLPIAIHTCMKTARGGKYSICDTHGVIDCAVCKKAEGTFTVFDSDSLGPDDIVVYDSLTQLTNSAISHITRNQADDYKPNWDDWGFLGKLMDDFLSHIQQAKYNVICISHETEAELEDGTTKLVPTAGTRNFSRNTAKYFDEVVYCHVKNSEHRAGSSTLYSGNILTGSRTGLSMEKFKETSLIPIFTGELPELRGNVASSNSDDTPSQKAVGGLKMSLASLKKSA